MLAPLVVVLAIADDVHIVQHYDHELRVTGDKKQAFTSAITHMFAPLLGASGTTALGMISLATSNVVAVRTFGIGAGVGVMIDFLISIVLVPALLTYVRPDPNPPPQERWLMRPLERAGRFAYSNAGLVMTIVLALSVVSAVGAMRLRVDTNHINFFAQTHPLSQSADVIDRQLSGIYSVNILLEGPPESLKTPDAMTRMERLTGDLEQLPYVRKATSVSTLVKRVNQQLNDDRPDAYRVPDSPEAIAQELFVFSLSEEGRIELSRIAASDFSRAQISIQLASMSSDLVFEQISEAERLAGAAFSGSEITPTVTGSGRLFSTLDHYLVTSQLSSFGTAFLTVFGVIFLVFRSVRFGVLGIVANVFPVVIVLGIMGWLDVSLNVATIMVASVALGIVDDDTIHFIGRYRREVGGGSGTREAVETAAISAYRGFEPFPVYFPLPPAGPAAPTALGVFPRFTMVGGDFETVKGPWGVRGELAVFPGRTTQMPDAPSVFEGPAFEGGVAIDRKAGNYRVSGTLMFSSGPDADEMTLVSSIDRSFARETRSVRAFAVYNPAEGSAFARVIASASLRDNVSVEGSVGLFTGSGVDVLSRFADRDFLYARFRVFF